MAKAGKTGVFEKHPNSQTVSFNGQFINLSAIARSQCIDQTYLSRIFAGKRTPSIPHCKKLSAILGLTIDQFLEALDIKGREVAAAEEKILQEHASRIASEDAADLKTFQAGGYPEPRLPALRSSV